jgi:stage II sporulation protein GA (sporulation sigma-E factor processing peptidase)
MRMKQTIYVDVLVAVNFFINYFLLLATSRFLAIPVRRGRLAAASALGAFFSLFILLPDVPAFLSLAVKLLMSVCIVLLAFRFHGIRSLVRETAAFYVMNFAFAGLMLALWYFLAPQGLVIRNSIVYFNISPVLLILLAAVCYLIIRLVNRITGRQMPKELFCRIVVSRAGVSCSCTARVDTGNSLREPFSNEPVAVVRKAAVERIIPPENSLNLRLVPFHTVSGSGVLQAFRPDQMTIYSGKRVISVPRVYIAVSKIGFDGCDALLNPDLLQKTSG